VWQNKAAALRAGWPLMLTILGGLVLRLKGYFTNLQDFRAVQGLLLWALVLFVAHLCASALNAGAWVRFVAVGEIHWHLRGRGFVPVVWMMLKLLLLLFSAAFAISFLAGLLLPDAVGPFAVMGVAIVLMGASALLAFSAIPYAALTGKCDLRGVFSLARSRLWESSRILVMFALIALLLILLQKGIENLAALALSRSEKEFTGDFVVGILLSPLYLASIQWAVGVSARIYLGFSSRLAPNSFADLESLMLRRLQSIPPAIEDRPL